MSEPARRMAPSAGYTRQTAGVSPAGSSVLFRTPVPDQYSAVQRPVGYRETGAYAFDNNASVYRSEPAYGSHSYNYFDPERRDATGGGPSLTMKMHSVSAAESAAEMFGEADPSLAMQRSSKVYSRQDPFWEEPNETVDRAGDAGWPPEPIQRSGKHKRAAAETARTVRNAVLMVIMVGAILLLAYEVMYRIRTIRVDGNSRVPAETVIALSGIHPGEHIRKIDTARVEDNINANRYLIFEGLKITDPDTVTIQVREREPAAVVNYCGMNYVIDTQGMVLEESSDVRFDSELMTVSGVTPSGQSGFAAGRQMKTANAAQLAVLKEILIELKVLGASERIEKLTVSEMDRLLLTTREGYSVNLGSREHLHEKLGAMLQVADVLNERGAGPGTINVSVYSKPTFIPES